MKVSTYIPLFAVFSLIVFGALELAISDVRKSYLNSSLQREMISAPPSSNQQSDDVKIQMISDFDRIGDADSLSNQTGRTR